MNNEKFHSVPDIFNAQTVPKSDEKSQKYRNQGDLEFVNRNFFDALNNYNKSISFAETKETAALAYSNRSDVYFELKLFDESLQNIQLAREFGYPADKLEKLNIREDKCKDLLAKSTDANKNDFWDFFKLSYPSNEKIPWLVDCVGIRKTKEFGRGIYAKHDLKAGDIICVEEPIFNYAYGDNAYRRCFTCFKANAINLIPCDRTASLMFCSTTCKDILYSKAINMTDVLSADVKMLSDIAKSFGTLKELENANLKEFQKTIFDFDLNDPKDPEYKNKLVMCLLSLSSNGRRVDRVCKSRNYINENASQHILSIFNLNFQKVNVGDGRRQFSSGLCIPLFGSLINHSRVSNVHRIMVDNKFVTIVVEPIKAGDQLFFCYPEPVAIRSKKIKEGLEEIHEFKCSCRICDLHRYPFFGFAENNYRDYNTAKKMLKSVLDGLNGLDGAGNSLFNFHTLESFLATNILEAIAYQCSFPFFSK